MQADRFAYPGFPFTHRLLQLREAWIDTLSFFWLRLHRIYPLPCSMPRSTPVSAVSSHCPAMPLSSTLGIEEHIQVPPLPSEKRKRSPDES